MAMLVMALGPRREVASLEATASASGCCRGNTAGARGAGLMPRRHRTQAGRTRARQPGPRRAGFLDALRATVHWLSLADGWRRRAGRPAGSRIACAISPMLSSTPRGSARGGTLVWETPRLMSWAPGGTPSWRLGSLAPGRSATRVSCSVLG